MSGFLKSRTKYNGLKFLESGQIEIAFVLENTEANRRGINNIKAYENDICLSVDKLKKKRSLDANAYAWVLMDKLAEKLNITAAEVYKNEIRHISGVSDVFCVREKAADKFIESWKRNGLGWQAEAFPSRIAGCRNIKVWYGSSVYDSKQMSSLLDSVIQEFKEQGIETMSPSETRELKSLWEKEDERRKRQILDTSGE